MAEKVLKLLSSEKSYTSNQKKQIREYICEQGDYLEIDIDKISDQGAQILSKHACNGATIWLGVTSLSNKACTALSKINKDSDMLCELQLDNVKELNIPGAKKLAEGNFDLSFDCFDQLSKDVQDVLRDKCE